MLKLKSTTKAVTVEYVDGRHTSTWNLDVSLTDDELADELRRIVGFYDAQTGKPALPERLPGFALGMAQEAHPRMIEVTEEEGMAMKRARPGSVTNGWAATAGVVPAPPELPADRQDEWELIPEDEQE